MSGVTGGTHTPGGGGGGGGISSGMQNGIRQRSTLPENCMKSMISEDG
jgi:hypothetical protein